MYWLHSHLAHSLPLSLSLECKQCPREVNETEHYIAFPVSSPCPSPRRGVTAALDQLKSNKMKNNICRAVAVAEVGKVVVGQVSSRVRALVRAVTGVVCVCVWGCVCVCEGVLVCVGEWRKLFHSIFFKRYSTLHFSHAKIIFSLSAQRKREKRRQTGKGKKEGDWGSEMYKVRQRSQAKPTMWRLSKPSVVECVWLGAHSVQTSGANVK